MKLTKRLSLSFILSVVSVFVPSVSQAGLRVSLLTCGAGSDVYELEGHTGLRFLDTGTGDDTVVHWGIFDFGSPGFIYRFVKGETDYRAGELPFRYFMAAYRMQGREVTEQVLDLTPDEACRLRALVDENLLPENRVYRYNYVKDNCATRPLRLVEKALGDTLTFRDEGAPRGATFRSEMGRFHRNFPWYQFGIDLALGSGIDYEISAREKTFAPLTLSRMLAGATVADGSGVTRPLVSSTSQLLPAAAGMAPEPTPWYLTPVAAGVLLLLITLTVTARDLRRRDVSRWFDTLLFLVSGLAGLVLTFLIFVSVHEATSPNWLYLWLNPLSLIIAGGVWLKKYNRVVLFCQIVNFAALILLLFLACFGVQVLNGAFILFIMSYLVRSFNYIYITGCVKKKIG